jgi:hypothetical protein
MQLRILNLAATLVAGGVALGRRAVDRRIEKRLPDEIEAAKATAIVELETQMSAFVGDRLRSFLAGLAVKAAILGAAFLFYAYGMISSSGLKIAVGTLIIGFILRDLFKAAPYILPGWRLAQKHKWNPKRALSDFVASAAFERAYEETRSTVSQGALKRWIAFSSYSPEKISNEVAAAVAEVAKTADYNKVKLRAVSGLALIGLSFFIYAAILALMLKAA